VIAAGEGIGPGEINPRHLERSEALERWARDTLLSDDALDLVLLGHTHLPRRVEVAPGRFYLNSGDWLGHRSWVEIEVGESPRLMAWRGGAPAPLHPAPLPRSR
jgi:hypothetical protein